MHSATFFNLLSEHPELDFFESFKDAVKIIIKYETKGLKKLN
jgi:hypothetical protein